MSEDVFVTDVPAEIYQALGGKYPTRQQWAAISAPLEPTVLVAGAGSGKTAVMAARMVWLVLNGHARANEILGLTFTNKAAESLLQRVRAAIEPLGLPEGEEPQIATYHSFAAGLINDYGLRAGIEPGASLLTEAQAWQLLSDLYLSRSYQWMEVRSTWHVSWLRSLAEDCANHLVEPEDVIAYDKRFLAENETDPKLSAKIKETAHKRVEFAQVVADFRDAKRARNVIDYGDQIKLACMLAADPQVAADFRARFRFALLDEYQDTNIAQARMLRSLMPPGYPVMAVGDPDQNIYAWRGASLRNLLKFPEDFLREDGSPAPALPLEVNFRSGKQILDLANTLIEGIPEERRPPDKVLRHFSPLGEANVSIFLESDQFAEAERIAAIIGEAHAAGTPWREMAILPRKRRLFAALVEVLRARDIPVEVIGLGGLLRTPEVVDLVAMLHVVADPMRNVALARILRGPRWRIGYRDLAVVARHASILNKELVASMPGEVESPGDVEFSLAEALEDIDQIEGVSDEARERLARFNAELAALRAQTHLPLPEFAAVALETLGLGRELDSSPARAAGAAKRNLANFIDRIAAFQPLDGEATLGALVDWLDAVEEADEDIDAAQPTEDDSVKLMTIHQAKGLEFDLVFIPGMVAGKYSKIFPDTSRQPNWATSQRTIPFDLRGDADVLPRFMGNKSSFEEELKDRAAEEERRLLYVAVTRARRHLVCSAAHWYEPAGMGESLKTPMEIGAYWREIREFPWVEVMVEVPQPEENPLIGRRSQRVVWPIPARARTTPAFPRGIAEAVKEARARTEPDLTLFPDDVVDVSAPGRRVLPATSLVTYARCPKRFYWSFVRPLPRRSSPAARVGTAFHAWLEQAGRGQITLYDPEEFEDREPTEDDSRMARLRSVFERTRFHGVKPARIEQAFALVLGEMIVQGRIDAIFEDDDGRWEIVDWKTGRAPASDGDERLQLDLYALAAQEIWGKAPEHVRLTFVYLGDEEATERTFEADPAEALRARTMQTLEAIAAQRFEPLPSTACRHCDFRRDCTEGRAWLADNADPAGA